MNPEERIQERIGFLEKQLDSLDHYPPETDQFHMQNWIHSNGNS